MLLLVRLYCLFFLVATPTHGASPSFVERAHGYDFVHEYLGGWEHFVGGGVAVFDCDEDGFAELYVAGGSEPARLLLNRTEVPGAEITLAELTPPALSLTGVIGAYPLDINGDDLLDLFVLRIGRNRVFFGEGGCQFRDGVDELGFEGGEAWSTAFSATWIADDVLPTLAVGNYVDRKDPEGPFGACDGNALHRPKFGRYGAPFVLEPGYCALSMLFSDWGRAGRQDLRISNDRHYFVREGHEQLWAMDEPPRAYSVEDGWAHLSIWGMGIASRDITGDGYPEVYLTSMSDQLLQFRAVETGAPTWANARYELGATAHRPYVGDDGRPSTGWHAEFGDIDNDGRDDIFVAKGNVDQMPESAMADPNNLLMQRADGAFEEVGASADLGSPHRGRGAALVDLNQDGRLDVVVVNRKAPLEVYENRTDTAGSWLSLDVRAPVPNTRLVGGWIEVRAGDRAWAREITVGGGHAGGQAVDHHFGLGEAKNAEVRVIGPRGSTSAWTPLNANMRYRIEFAGEGQLKVGEASIQR